MPFSQAFRFESTVVPLPGTVFRPLRDAVTRWVAHCPESFEGLGTRFRILYELPDARFVFLEYGCCHEQLVGAGEDAKRLWVSDTPPQGNFLPSERALGFILKHQFEIPPSLESVLEEHVSGQARPNPPRPLNHWAGKGYLQHKSVRPAHEVNLPDEVDRLFDATVRMVQEVRSWSGLDRHEDQATRLFAGVLFQRYPVDHRTWWGDKSRVPPADVGLQDLPWPESMNGLRNALVELQSLTEGPLCVLTWMGPLGSSDSPTVEERAEARAFMISAASSLEGLAHCIQMAQETLAKPQEEPAAPPTVASVDAPNEKELRIFLLSVTEPGTQKDVAERYTERYRMPMDQGQVSRAIAKVRKWLDAGNPLPAMSPAESVKSVDPAVLDMGASGEGRTPRQRKRRSE